MDRWVLWFAAGFGLGRSPIMPGTIGCLVGLPLGWGLMQIDSLGIQILIAAVLVLVSIPLCDRAEKLIGGKDPQSIVADEYLTLPICVIGLSAPLYLISGFIFHRIFDITKPPPIRNVQSLSGGWGVVVDDLLAALLAWGCNTLLAYGISLLCI